MNSVDETRSAWNFWRRELFGESSGRRGESFSLGRPDVRGRWLRVRQLGIEDAERHDSWVQGARAIREF